MMFKTSIALTIASFLLSFFAVSAHAFETTQFSLDNGLRVVIAEDSRAPILHCQVWYQIGSVDEEKGATGLSHMLEHLMFQGTKQFPDDAYSQKINSLGGTYNAGTMTDKTFYYAVIPSDNVDDCLAMEADRMRNLNFNPDKFLSERDVVKEERRMRIEDNPFSKAREQFIAQIYPTGGYHHPIIGWMEDISVYEKAKVYDWYQRWYAPNNAVLVLAGDIDAKAVAKKVKKVFGAVEQSDRINHAAPYRHQPVINKTQTVSVGSDIPMIMLGYQVPSWFTRAAEGEQATKENDKELIALDMLVSLLSQGNSARLEAELVRKQKLATSAGASYSMLQRGDSIVYFYLAPVPTEQESGNAGSQTFAPLETAFYTLLEKLKSEPVDVAELERIKTQTIASMIYRKDSLRAQVNEVASLALSNLPLDFYEQYIDMLSAVTPQDIQKAATKFFVESKRAVTYIPADAEVK